MPRIVLAFLAVGILAMMAVAGSQAALETAGEDHTINSETWTPDAGNVTTLDESNRDGAYYNETAVVKDENGNDSEAGVDYEWFAGNGTVKALSGGNLDGDTSATITYSFQQTTEEQRQFAAMLAELPRLIGIALPVGAILFLFLLIRGG